MNEFSQQEQHKTNYFALALLVLFTVFLLVTVFNDDIDQQFVEQTAFVSTEQNVNKTQEITTFESFKTFLSQDIPVDANAVVENRLIARGGEEPVEQIIIYKTAKINGELAQVYRNWLEESGYITQEERVGNYAATLAATRGNSAVTILISYLTGENMAEVEIINYRR